jgi:hypothetical protein
MTNNIDYSIATVADIPGFLALQEKFLVTNLTDEQKKNGFVTTPFKTEQLTDIINQTGLFVAKDAGVIIAYAFGGSWEYFSQWPIFNVMIEKFPTLVFKHFVITDTNSFQYGPICIDEKYRGSGLLNEVFELMRANLVKRYPLSLTFINKINPRSLKAHVDKLHWTIIGEFTFNNNNYFILALDITETVINGQLNE